MSAAARPRRRGVSRQAKVRVHFTRTYLTGRAIQDNLGYLGWQKDSKEFVCIKWNAADGSELVPTTDVKKTLPYFTLPEETSHTVSLRKAVKYRTIVGAARRYRTP
jgi:hypothetical protein